MMWAEYPYKASPTNPYSLMAHERGRLFFVTCAETEHEIEATAQWHVGLRPEGNPLAIYHDGKLMKAVR